MTPGYIRRFLENPSNFSKEQWAQVEKKRKDLLDSLQLPSEHRDKTITETPPPDSRKETKDRKGKNIGARRRWIPMR